MGKKTPLYNCHLAAGAKIVDFAGWDMPLNYGSQVKEHHVVRQGAGMFDVSHMTVIDCHGSEVAIFLRKLLSNNIDRLIPGKALYTCMLNEQGGIIDDLIVYQLEEQFYRLIVNAGTSDKDLTWIKQQANGFQLTIQPRTDLLILAVQGPEARQKLASIVGQGIISLKPFHAIQIDHYFIACTGYTGEDGFEMLIPADHAEKVWHQLLQAGVQPCGLGSRDTLRLEAGLNLYGSDMDESVTPLESNLAWTIAWEPSDRDFIGRAALEKQKTMGITHSLIGLVLVGPGVLRNHQKVWADGKEVGEITSGSFSPTLNKGIALARVVSGVGPNFQIEIRGKYIAAQMVKLPFVHHSKKSNVKTVEL